MADKAVKGDLDVNIVDYASQQKVSGILSPNLVTSSQYLLGTKSCIFGRAETVDFVDLRASDSGYLKTVFSPPKPPSSGGTAVIQTQASAITTTVGADSFYTITNTKVIRLQRLQAGSQGSNDGSCVDLYYAPNGNTTGMTFLTSLYVNGSTNIIEIDDVFTGNGTRAILLRRRNFSGGSVEVFGRWTGYEV